MIIAAVVLLLIGLSFLPIRLFITYKEKVFDIVLKVGPLRIALLKDKGLKKKSEDKKKKKAEKDFDIEDKLNIFFNILQAFYNTSNTIRKSIIIEKLRIKSEIGFEDAAVTGIIIGLAYAEIYKLFGFLGAVFTVTPPDITITPIYEEKQSFSIDAEGIIKSNSAHIIYTVIKFYKNYNKSNKERID